jgi:hypothetical protein
MSGSQPAEFAEEVKPAALRLIKRLLSTRASRVVVATCALALIVVVSNLVNIARDDPARPISASPVDDPYSRLTSHLPPSFECVPIAESQTGNVKALATAQCSNALAEEYSIWNSASDAANKLDDILPKPGSCAKAPPSGARIVESWESEGRSGLLTCVTRAGSTSGEIFYQMEWVISDLAITGEYASYNMTLSSYEAMYAAVLKERDSIK